MNTRTPILVAAALAGAFAVAAAPGLAADHPGADSACGDCHTAGSGPAGAPKVVPQPPGFFARLFGEKPLQGHPSVSCAGQVGADGTVTGCHAPGNGAAAFLVGGQDGRPTDELCGSCHDRQRVPGAHHPTYRADRDRDGTPDTPVRPASGQEVYTDFAAPGRPAPLPRYPDALVFRTAADGTRVREVVLPLQRVVEVVEGQEVVEADLVTCTTCHNPHHGYLVEVGSEEELDQEQVARETGDALLRLRDYDNALCEACH